MPPAPTEPAWRDVAPADDFAPDSARPAMKAGVRLVVGRSGDDWFALDGICPHAGAVLGEGMVDGGLLICPLHAFAFDVATGHCDDDPGCSVRAYPVRVREGTVQVLL